jgi:CheY-like chemotaxis protein
MATMTAEATQANWDTSDDAYELPQLEGVRVLVVDDQHEAREAITAVLEDCGAEVMAFASAASALEALGRAKPDVLVSDIAMPGMDGHRLMRRIRALDLERGGATPALALTAYATVADRTRALLAGYQVYLAKPFEPAELVALVANLAGRSPAA